MKVKETLEDWGDGRRCLSLKIETRGSEDNISFHDGEVEDNSINRNFKDILKITQLLKSAHAAGAAGETFEYELIELKEEEI